MQKLPDVRRIFIPDPGWTLIDADQVGADARVMAWEAGGKYKADFISGVKMHVETMKYIYPDAYVKDPKHEPQYTKCKNMHYGTNYVGSARGIASQAAIPLHMVQRFQPWHFAKYPEIKDVHRRVEYSLATTREVWNRLGYRVHYFGRTESLLPDAVNWLCQSTVACVTQRGKVILFREFRNVVQLLLDVHDSLIFQVKTNSLRQVLPELRQALDSIVVPYPDPLRLPWSFKSSDRSWGEAEPVKWERFDVAA